MFCQNKEDVSTSLIFLPILIYSSNDQKFTKIRFVKWAFPLCGAFQLCRFLHSIFNFAEVLIINNNISHTEIMHKRLVNNL